MTEGMKQPVLFDRLLDGLGGLPDVTKTHPTTLYSVTKSLGIGGTTSTIVQTFRQSREKGGADFYVFVTQVEEGRVVRLVLQPPVAEAIARQRGALGAQALLKSRRGK